MVVFLLIVQMADNNDDLFRAQLHALKSLDNLAWLSPPEKQGYAVAVETADLTHPFGNAARTWLLTSAPAFCPHTFLGAAEILL